jgi:ribosomal protein L32
MPTRKDGRTPGQPTASGFVPNRQMTIGECIAMDRYGSSVEDEKLMTLAELLLLIDRLEVCTTCGWSERMHRLTMENEHVIGLCAHYERQL